MDIKRGGSQPSIRGPADWFTGTVRIDPLFPVTPPARAAGNTVTFEPGARTAWHTHPLGQTLIVAGGWSLADVIAYMGHSGSPSMIYSHYRNVVSEEDAKRWFGIVP